jgi:hypothetical protein
MAKLKAAKGETETAAAMNAFLRDPADAQAIALVSGKDPSWNATLRTTCVATLLDAGHATNALPQRARANITAAYSGNVRGGQAQSLKSSSRIPRGVTTLETQNRRHATPASRTSWSRSKR